MKKPTPEEQKYLNDLRESEFHAIDQFDKTLLMLAGGAFGVSFAFLKDIIKTDKINNPDLLTWAWMFWCLVLALNLTSFYFSHLAMRKAQRDFRPGAYNEEANLGGFYNKAVVWLNPMAGVMFIAGLICMSIFVTNNLHGTKSSPPDAVGTSSNPATNAPAVTTTEASANSARTTSAKGYTTP